MENFLYIRWRKTIVGLQQKISYSPPSPHTTIIMPSTPQILPAELRQQVEEMKRAWEAREKEECEQEEEERKQRVEAALEAERELREQGW